VGGSRLKIVAVAGYHLFDGFLDCLFYDFVIGDFSIGDFGPNYGFDLFVFGTNYRSLADLRLNLLQDFGEEGRFASVHFGRGRLFVPEIVIAVAGAAANLGGSGVDHRHHCMVHHPLTPHAIIVDIVAQTDITHRSS
jgi:hypothetical protein